MLLRSEYTGSDSASVADILEEMRVFLHARDVERCKGMVR